MAYASLRASLGSLPHPHLYRLEAFKQLLSLDVQADFRESTAFGQVARGKIDVKRRVHEVVKIVAASPRSLAVQESVDLHQAVIGLHKFVTLEDTFFDVPDTVAEPFLDFENKNKVSQWHVNAKTYFYDYSFQVETNPPGQSLRRGWLSKKKRYTYVNTYVIFIPYIEV